MQTVRMKRSPLRINVVEPQPSCNATVVVKDWRLSNFKTKVPDDSSTEESSSSDDEDPKSSRSPEEPLSDASEEPSDPKAAFFRALNLLPASLQGERGRWPLRRISRVQPDWPRPITDLTPLSCGVGQRLLREKQLVALEKESRAAAAVRKYEGLCVASGLPEPNPCHARLRCRRVAYPVCTTGKTLLRAESTHVYSYGRRQRRERLRVIETGLDRRSRRLLAQCKDCQVQLERVSKEEIKRWRRKTPHPPPRPVEEKPQQQQRTLAMRLPDVTRFILRNSRNGQYYLSGTGIQVLDYAEFLAARRPKNSPELIDLTLDSPPKANSSCRLLARNQLHNSVPRGRSTQPPSASRQRPDRLGSSTQPRSVLVRNSNNSVGSPASRSSHVGNSLLRQRPAYVSLSVPRHQQRSHLQASSRQRLNNQANDGQAHGPVLRAMLQERQLPTHFRCFACGCNRYISGNAELEVLEHMRRFHSVIDPDRFLTVYRDLVKRCTIVEAFPGYKGNN